jgi:hypothetical protein
VRGESGIGEGRREEKRERRRGGGGRKKRGEDGLKHDSSWKSIHLATCSFIKDGRDIHRRDKPSNKTI